jgi:hypothetical protein
MKTTSRSTRLMLLLAILILSMLAVAPTQAAPHISGESHRPACAPFKHIQNWHSIDQLERWGFNAVVDGDQASVHFNGDLSLDLARNPSNTQSQVSRMTEIDASIPIAQRVKCWEAAPGRDVVVEFRERFDRPATPPNLAEDLFLWNAPLAGPNNPAELPHLLTAIGVSRTSAFGAPMYVAEVVQDLDLTTFNGLLKIELLPNWLNPAAWHNVRITLSQTNAKIEVAQGDQPFTLALQTALPHPAEPLGFELSVETSGPIATADGLNVSCLDIRKVPSVLSNLPIRPSLCRK